MKRSYSLLGIIAVLLSGVFAACSGDLLDSELESENPYIEEAQATLAGLVDHSIDFVSTYHGTRSDPGLVLLEAIDAYAPLSVDLDIDEVASAIAQVANHDRKAPSQRPFDPDESLNTDQKRFLHRLLDRAETATTGPELRSILTSVENAAVTQMGPEAARPIHIVSAFIQAQFAYFSDDANAPAVRRLSFLLGKVAPAVPASDHSRLRILAIQDVTPRPPPTWTSYFRPGNHIRQLVSDVRSWAEAGTLIGGGTGCAVGSLAGGAGCMPGAGVGAVVGALSGAVLGLVVSGVANGIDAARDYQAAAGAWCDEQARLDQVLRHQDYDSRCNQNQN
ncbi:MAG: hypothetical protein ACI9W4_000854 [Rhodothermales bacterium]|jgi:hypothetical protein